MAGAFIKLLNMSIAAGWLVLAVILLRFVLKKAPKWVNPLLWGVVALRLVMPFSVESVLSLIPSAQTVSTVPAGIQSQPEAVRPVIDSGVQFIDNAVNPVISQAFVDAPSPEAVAEPVLRAADVAAIVWAVGLAALLLYAAVSWLRLRSSVSTAVRLRDNVYQSEFVSSPFVLGMFSPKIYLPFAIDSADAEYVIAHERAHIARRDTWIKPIGYLLLCVYWFNPVMWLAYVLLCRDIEYACDERVVSTYTPAERADYSEALLTCSVKRAHIAACPVAFGEASVKDRVKRVLSYKKPAFWIAAAAVAAVVVVAVCFLTDPVGEEGAGAQGISEPAVGASPDEVTMLYEDAGNLPGEVVQSVRSCVSDIAGEIGALGESDAAGEAFTVTGAGVLYTNWHLTEYGESEIALCRVDYSIDISPALSFDYSGWSFTDGQLSERIYLFFYQDEDGYVLFDTAAQEYIDGFGSGQGIEKYDEAAIALFNEYQRAMYYASASFTLPEGLTLGQFDRNIGYLGGWVLGSDAYEFHSTGNNSGREYAYSEGSILTFNAADYPEGIVERSGASIENIVLSSNHTWLEDGHAVSSDYNMKYSAYAAKQYYDLYVASDLEELADMGVDVKTIPTQSEYWTVYIVHPALKIGYQVSLAANRYSLEDTIYFARSLLYHGDKYVMPDDVGVGNEFNDSISVYYGAQEYVAERVNRFMADGGDWVIYARTESVAERIETGVTVTENGADYDLVFYRFDYSIRTESAPDGSVIQTALTLFKSGSYGEEYLGGIEESELSLYGDHATAARLLYLKSDGSERIEYLAITPLSSDGETKWVADEAAAGSLLTDVRSNYQYGGERAYRLDFYLLASRRGGFDTTESYTINTGSPHYERVDELYKA